MILDVSREARNFLRIFLNTSRKNNQPHKWIMHNAGRKTKETTINLWNFLSNKPKNSQQPLSRQPQPWLGGAYSNNKKRNNFVNKNLKSKTTINLWAKCIKEDTTTKSNNQPTCSHSACMQKEETALLVKNQNKKINQPPEKYVE